MGNEVTVEFFDQGLRDALEGFKKWDTGTRRASKLECYGVVGKCADLYELVHGNAKLIKHLNAQLTDRKIPFNNGTSLGLRVVRYVFGKFSQEFDYAKTITLAGSKKPPTTSMIDWLMEHGGPAGIASMNAEGKTKATARKAKIALAEKHYESCPALASIKASVAKREPNSTSGNQFALALVRRAKPGQYDIVFGTNNATLLDQVLAEAGKVVATTTEHEATTAKSSSRRQAVDAAIEEFTNKAEKEDA